MIFLAVTLGFFAENVREKLTEKHNSREYAKLLVNDLTENLAEFNRTDHVLKKIINCGDSLSDLIHSNDIQKIPAGKLYYYEYWSGWQWKVTTRDATFKQLESSGALRYLGKATLIKKILDYEESTRIVSLLEGNMELQKNDNWNLVQKVFDVSYFRVLQTIGAAARDSSSQTYQSDVGRLDSFVKSNYPLLTYDKNTWMELSNRASTSSDGYRNLLKAVNHTKIQAQKAIAALKREY